MPKKLDRCVKSVKSQNKKRKTNYNPYAVCKSSIRKKRVVKSKKYRLIRKGG